MSDIAFSVIINNNGIDDIIFKTIMLKGEKGNSVDHVEKTSTSGLVDTYTIYLSDGTVGGTFTVTNGSPVNIDDSVTALDKTWSSSKLSGMIKSIDDTTVDADKLWSSQKINSMLTQTGTIQNQPIASFADGADDVPASSLIVDINVVQDSSGDPSPSNVRPISGWSECNIIKNGFNHFDEQWESGSINPTSGLPTPNASWSRSTQFIPVVPNTLYYFFISEVSSNNNAYVFYYDQNQHIITNYQFTSSTARTTPSNCKFIKFQYKRTYDEIANYPVCINLNDANKNGTYEPYKGGIDTIDFGQTVYGGTLDVSNGIITAKRWFKQFTWGNGINATDMGNNTRKIFKFESQGYNVYPPHVVGFPQLCNVAPYVANFITDDEHFYCNANECILFLPDNTPNDTIVQFSGELVTPLTIQLTPTEVRTLLNENHIFADTGNVDELIYFKTGSETIARLIEAYLRGE